MVLDSQPIFALVGGWPHPNRARHKGVSKSPFRTGAPTLFFFMALNVFYSLDSSRGFNLFQVAAAETLEASRECGTCKTVTAIFWPWL